MEVVKVLQVEQVEEVAETEVEEVAKVEVAGGKWRWSRPPTWRTPDSTARHPVISLSWSHRAWRPFQKHCYHSFIH